MTNTIIIIYPYRFREFDYKRFEIDCLGKYNSNNIIIFELIDVLHKNFTEAYHVKHEDSQIIRPLSISEWKQKYIKIIKSCERKPYVINFVPSSSLKEFFINYILSSTNVFLIKYDNAGSPNYRTGLGIGSKIYIKYKFLIKRATFSWLIYTLLSIFSRYLGLLICRDSDYTMLVNNSNNSHKKGIISANSFDYSMFISQARIANFDDNDEEIIVYLDTGSPLFRTDSLLTGAKTPLTIDSWYPSLVNFFDVLEKRTSKVIVIASHPKHKYSNENQHYFGDRKIISGKTQELVAKASLVLVTNSSAVSYAVIYNKPVLIMLSDEIIIDNNILLQGAKYLSNILGCPSINIDKVEYDKLNKFIVDKDKYLSYKAKYLSSRSDNKSNCEIIIDEIINHESRV